MSLVRSVPSDQILKVVVHNVIKYEKMNIKNLPSDPASLCNVGCQ